MEGHGPFSYIWSASRKINMFIVLYNVLFTSRFVGSRSLCLQTRRLDLDNELYDANRKKLTSDYTLCPLIDLILVSRKQNPKTYDCLELCFNLLFIG